MEGFTIVLLIGWLILVSTFVGMYFLDQAVKKRSEGQPPPTAPPPARRG